MCQCKLLGYIWGDGKGVYRKPKYARQYMTAVCRLHWNHLVGRQSTRSNRARPLFVMLPAGIISSFYEEYWANNSCTECGRKKKANWSRSESDTSHECIRRDALGEIHSERRIRRDALGEIHSERCIRKTCLNLARTQSGMHSLHARLRALSSRRKTLKVVWQKNTVRRANMAREHGWQGPVVGYNTGKYK